MHHRHRLTLALLAGLALAASAPAAAAGPVARLVAEQRAQGARFADFAPFAGAERIAVRDVLREGTQLALRAGALAAVRDERPETLRLALPHGLGAIELELVRVDPFTPDFAVVTSDGGTVDAREHGVHYRGVVAGAEDSLASISVYAREVMGFVQSPALGHLTLGRMPGENPRDTHLLYASDALIPKPSFRCDMAAADETPTSAEELLSLLDAQLFTTAEHQEMAALAGECVRIYVEADYDIYQNKGSVAAVTNYLTGLFAQSATLYSNESIPIAMSELYIWTRRSPYKGNSSSQLLTSFQKNRKSFNGDLGHLVAFRGGGGIAAGFNGFCAARRSDSQCFSMIDPTYANVPNYSWSVMVFTHEMGHLMGSRHTHACVWNGNNTQIDGCYTPEGTCPRVGFPSGGGTVMSYCHLQSVGINFNNGFGPQPGDVIRSRYAGASCLTACP